MALNAKQWGAILISALFALSFIGLIGIGGGADAVTGAATTTLDYNGYTLNKVGNYWQIDSNGQSFLFINPPSALENFEIPPTQDIISTLQFNKIYLSYDPSQSLDLSQLRLQSISFFSNFNIQSFQSCTKEENCPDIPIIDCDVDHGIIFIQDNNQTTITSKGYCLEIHAANIETMQRQLERLFYVVLGVMQ